MINVIQLIIVILLIITILLQQRGSGLGAAFGGEGAIYRTKRGAEKTIFFATIILALLFLGLSLINIYLNTKKPTLPDLTPTNQSDESQNLPKEEPNIEDTINENNKTNNTKDNPFNLGKPQESTQESTSE